MKFNPNVQARPENDFKFNLLQAGVCNFYVLNATEESGNYGPYIQLTIKAQDSSKEKLTSEITVFLSVDEKNGWKLQEFMQEIGEINQFNTGNINVQSLINKKGQVMIQHKEYLSKKDGELKLSNHVASFADRTTIPATWKYKPKQGNDQINDHSANQNAADYANKNSSEFSDDVPF